MKYTTVDRSGNLIKRLVCWWSSHQWKTPILHYYHDGSSSRTHTCAYCQRTLYEAL